MLAKVVKMKIPAWMRNTEAVAVAVLVTVVISLCCQSLALVIQDLKYQKRAEFFFFTMDDFLRIVAHEHVQMEQVWKSIPFHGGKDYLFRI